MWREERLVRLGRVFRKRSTLPAPLTTTWLFSSHAHAASTTTTTPSASMCTKLFVVGKVLRRTSATEVYDLLVEPTVYEKFHRTGYTPTDVKWDGANKINYTLVAKRGKDKGMPRLQVLQQMNRELGVITKKYPVCLQSMEGRVTWEFLDKEINPRTAIRKRKRSRLIFTDDASDERKITSVTITVRVSGGWLSTRLCSFLAKIKLKRALDRLASYFDRRRLNKLPVTAIALLSAPVPSPSPPLVPAPSPPSSSPATAPAPPSAVASVSSSSSSSPSSPSPSSPSSPSPLSASTPSSSTSPP